MADEQEGSGTQETSNQEQASPANSESQGHPAHKEILDVLPESLHHLVQPTLEKWDKGVQEQFQKIHSQYDPYKELIENKIAAEDVKNALWLASEIETNPESIVEQAIEAFGLDYVKKVIEEEIEFQETEDDDLYEQPTFDVTKSPEFIAMKKQLEEVSKGFREEQQTKAQQAAQEKFDAELEQLKTDHGDYDKVFVTALMSQGIDGAEAVKRYHETVNQAAARIAGTSGNQQQNETPVVLGGSGSTGSGLPTNPVPMGDMPTKDINQLVADLVKTATD